MKKTILIAFACFVATAAQAVTWTWSATGIKFDNATLKNSTAVTGYLIYLGTSSLSDSYAVTKASTASSIAASITPKSADPENPNPTIVSSVNKTSAVGKLTGEWTFDYGTTFNNGDNFAVLLQYVVGEKPTSICLRR